MTKLSVLFVCTENICRSPLAHAMLVQRLRQVGLQRKVTVDSAGTYCSQPGCKPDPRSVKVAKAAGVKLKGIKARRIAAPDFQQFDFILPMDEDNHRALLRDCPPELSGRVQKVLAFAPDLEAVDVPDPYYGNAAGFQSVYDLLDIALEGLIYELNRRVQLSP